MGVQTKIFKNRTTMCIVIKNLNSFVFQGYIYCNKVKSNLGWKGFCGSNMYKMRPNSLLNKFTLARRLTQIGISEFGFAVTMGFVLNFPVYRSQITKTVGDCVFLFFFLFFFSREIFLLGL